MVIQFSQRSGGCQSQSSCPDQFGCDGTCPDFVIKRHDTRPSLKIAISDCEGPMDFQGLVIEANMWALSKLKIDIDDTIDYFRLADDIGFEQVMVGDIIFLDRVRLPEHMLVIGFDEVNKLVRVQRGYHGTTPTAWKKGTKVRIFRILNGQAESEMVFNDETGVDETGVDGTVARNVLQESYLIYEWQPEDTCLPGCYWFEFKVLKMVDAVFFLPGGNWTGPTYQDNQGYFWTGSMFSDGSTRLSYDQVTGYYLIDEDPWAGEFHLWSDNNYYTGTVQNDASVVLNKTGVPSDDSVARNSVSFADISIIPSFTDDSLTAYNFGCVLGEGVESVRRFPLDYREGFLIKILNSPTGEL